MGQVCSVGFLVWGKSSLEGLYITTETNYIISVIVRSSLISHEKASKSQPKFSPIHPASR
jgi:hypothetical protein